MASGKARWPRAAPPSTRFTEYEPDWLPQQRAPWRGFGPGWKRTPDIVQNVSHTNSIHKVYLTKMQGAEQLRLMTDLVEASLRSATPSGALSPAASGALATRRASEAWRYP